MLHPALRLKRMQYLERLFLVANLLQFPRLLMLGEMLDDLIALGILVSRLGSLFQFETQPRLQPRGADHQRRIVEKAVVGNQPQQARFDISNAIRRVHQQPIRALVQRNRHRIDRKVPRAQILLDAGPVVNRLPWLGILGAARALQVHAHIPGKAQVKRARRRIFAPDLAAGARNRRFQFQRVSVYNNFQIANRIPAG
jgi:hypothetical protein